MPKPGASHVESINLRTLSVFCQWVILSKVLPFHSTCEKQALYPPISLTQDYVYHQLLFHEYALAFQSKQVQTTHLLLITLGNRPIDLNLHTSPH